MPGETGKGVRGAGESWKELSGSNVFSAGIWLLNDCSYIVGFSTVWFQLEPNVEAL